MMISNGVKVKIILVAVFVLLATVGIVFAQPYQATKNTIICPSAFRCTYNPPAFPSCSAGCTYNYDYNLPCQYDFLIYKTTVLGKNLYRIYYCEKIQTPGGSSLAVYSSRDANTLQEARAYVAGQREVRLLVEKEMSIQEQYKKAKWEKAE